TLGDVPPVVQHDPGHSAVTWVPMDVTVAESVEQVLEEIRPEVVYHLAGQSSVGESFENPVLTWEVNATGTLRLAVAMSRMAVAVRRLVIVSSAEVYGSVEWESQPIEESSPLRPVTPYGVS